MIPQTRSRFREVNLSLSTAATNFYHSFFVVLSCVSFLVSHVSFVGVFNVSDVCINYRLNDAGATLLHLACTETQSACIFPLLQNGASPVIK